MQSQTQGTLSQDSGCGWGLAGVLPGRAEIARVAITSCPFTIGRNSDRSLVLQSNKVSKNHAELLISEAVAVIRDVGSTNGTFVNGLRIYSPTPIGARDLIQLADVSLWLIRDRTVSEDLHNSRNDLYVPPPRVPEESRRDPSAVVYQAIVDTHENSIFGFDAYPLDQAARSNPPSSQFDTVIGLDLESPVIQGVRERAAEDFSQSRIPGALFLKVDRDEDLREGLLHSLASIRVKARERVIVLQIDEGRIGDRNQMVEFASALRVLQIRLALVGFSFGPARLRELASLQPDFIKLDVSLCRNLDRADHLRLRMVTSLHHVASELGIRAIADGLETSESVKACRDIGFQLLQGSALAPAMHL
ncbi:MAG: EAL domain-containing protein, partial [Planctomycetota bacterium]